MMKFFGTALLASLLIGVVLVVAATLMSGAMDGAVIQINGEPVGFAQLGPLEWLFAIGGVAVALWVAVLVVPLALLLPFGFVLLAFAAALLAVAGAVAVAFSPLLLLVALVWLIVRLARRSGRKNPANSSATIAR